MAKKLEPHKKLKQRKFSLSDEDWTKVQKEAQSQKISVSDLVRKKLNVGQDVQSKNFDRRPTKKADPALLKLIKNFTTNLNQIAKHCNTNKELDNIALELLSEMSTDIKNLADLKSNNVLVIDSVTSKISEPNTLDKYQITNYSHNVEDDIEEDIITNTINNNDVQKSGDKIIEDYETMIAELDEFIENEKLESSSEPNIPDEIPFDEDDVNDMPNTTQLQESTRMALDVINRVKENPIKEEDTTSKTSSLSKEDNPHPIEEESALDRKIKNAKAKDLDLDLEKLFKNPIKKNNK